MRGQIDTSVRLLARAAARLWFRTVEVVGAERLPASGSGPVLLVASHFNGLLDPLLVAATTPAVPRFLAKSTLWRNPLLARFLDSAGAIPVHRAGEGSTAANVQAFAACYEALARGETVALFPEGVTHDEPRLAELRTGAARIALGAREQGAVGLVLLPVGLIYTDKASPRSRALVRFGRPIHLDRHITLFVEPGAPQGPGNVDAVRRLTAEIHVRLAEAALDYDDAGFALLAVRAALVALRPDGAPRSWRPTMDEVDRTARALVAAPREQQRALVAAGLPYADALTLLGLEDADVVAGDLTAAAVGWRLGRLAALAAMSPAAAVGVAVNAPAVSLVSAAGLLPVSAAMRGTARLLAGLVTLPATWIALRQALRARGKVEPTLLALAAGPGCGIVAMGLIERLRALRSARDSYQRLRAHAAVLPVLRAQRAALVDAVRHATRVAPGRSGEPASAPPAAQHMRS